MRFALVIVVVIAVLLLWAFLFDRRQQHRNSGRAPYDVDAGIRRARGRADTKGAGGP
jgi:hypothetical protein